MGGLDTAVIKNSLCVLPSVPQSA